MDLKIHSSFKFNKIGTFYFPKNMRIKNNYIMNTTHISEIFETYRKLPQRNNTKKGNASNYCKFTPSDELTKAKLCYIYLG